MIGQETNGPGGMFKALRTIPVILKLLKTVKNCVQMLGSFLLQILLESMLKQCLDILAGKNLLGYVMDL